MLVKVMLSQSLLAKTLTSLAFPELWSMHRQKKYSLWKEKSNGLMPSKPFKQLRYVGAKRSQKKQKNKICLRNLKS